MENKQLVDTIALAMANAMADMHTHTIARVTAVGTTTISCRPVINRVIDGVSVELPEFVQVPPIFFNGGASYTAHPIAVGDYCLLLISERCFDNWYAGRDYLTPLEMRMHDYSDGFALVGLKPAAGAITIPTETTSTGVHRIGKENPTDHAALAAKVLTELESIKADFDALKAAFDAHVHGGVLGGPSSTAPPAAPAPDAHTPASVASQYIKTD